MPIMSQHWSRPGMDFKEDATTYQVEDSGAVHTISVPQSSSVKWG